MATTRNGGRVVVPANVDLSTKQYYIVKLSGANAVLSSAATDLHLGVLQNAPIAGDSCDIVGRHSANTGKVIAGGTLTPNCDLTSDASGKAVATTTANDQVIGKYLGTSNAAANDIVEFAPASYKVSAA